MLKNKTYISNKEVAYNGAMVAITAVLSYSLVVMIYVIIRSSASIYGSMPKGERNSILWSNAISVSYSVAIFSLIMAAFSAVTGILVAIVLRKLLLYFNHRFSLSKAVLISCFTALALLILMYILLYFLLNERMTFDYAETFLFWFLYPAFIFFAVCIIGGIKLNKLLDTELQ